MAQKCVHQGCGKMFTDPDEVCYYHPGPPVFHEGQKGWKCCKPRVLTFEEFMAIPPCTEGRHSTTDLPPKIEKKIMAEDAPTTAAGGAETVGPAMPRVPIAMPTREKQGTTTALPAATATPSPPPPLPESDEDDLSLEIPAGRVCRRRGCGAVYVVGTSRENETCVFHPGVPIFHEGSKGYSCCKRRVLEFDEFLKIAGCQTKERHLFVGSGRKGKSKARQTGATGDGAAGGAAEGSAEGTAKTDEDEDEERLDSVRFDFYQSATTLTASFFLKKIDKQRAVVNFSEQAIDLDLPTTDAPLPKRYKQRVSLYGEVDPAKCKYTVLGTKLEVVLAKAAISSWPVLRSDDQPTGAILQVARAGKIER